MKSFFDKAASTVASGVALAIGAAFAGLGLMIVMTLAVFALGAAGLAFLARPFVARALDDARKENVSA